MLNRLLETKFHIPTWRDGGVFRPRLLERLQAGVNEHRKLTLISAPAGYGKTTLVAEWLDQKVCKDQPPLPIAWLSLDETDNDPTHFLSYWLSALQREEVSLGQSAQSLLDMPQIPPIAAILDELINDLAAIETQIILILDDYHVINNPAIHEALEYFLEHQPAQIHLIITTRIDPPLPLSRLRARGQVTEVRAHDLRFTAQEARQFFRQSMNLDLAEEAVNTIEARTEGWAVGLQLAGLALQSLPDQEDFLADFRGSHRYIIDYLLDEVLKRQPAEIRTFLSKTSVLSRFNADLCQAVTGNSASADILAGLERSNLFLIPLDDQRGWYRYHHLFADALQVGLDAATEREIRTAAADWFERQGLFPEAVTHWLAVPDAAQAARLISHLAPTLLKAGELQTLLGWLNALPEAVVSQNPDLVSHMALSLLLTGQTVTAYEYASRAYQTFSGQNHHPGQGRLLAMQAWFAINTGDPRAGELASAALDKLDQDDSFFRALSLISLGNFHAWNLDLPASSQVFRETWLLGRQMKHPFIALGALANLAFNLLEKGQLREAESLCRAALAEYVDNRGRQLPILGMIYIPLASICFEKGEFVEAQSLAERGIALCKRLFSNLVMGGDSEITLARIAFESGNPEQAFALLDSTADDARQRGMTFVVFKMAIARTELYLLQDRLAEAEICLNEIKTQGQSGLAKSERMTAHLRARFLAASGDWAGALQILDQIEQTSRKEGHVRRLMGTLLTQALVYLRKGSRDQATLAIESSLRMAAPEGYRSLYIHHPGRPTQALLESVRAVAPDFIDSILKTQPDAEEDTSSFAALPDPLSEQEIRVLKHIVAGKSNQEIAEGLFISVGTAKWHVHNILQKMGVNNRAQAIARARELGIG